MKSSARFLIENGRVTRIKRLDKVAFVTLYATTGKINQFFDITDFALAKTIGEGESVTVKGEVSMRKPKDGGRQWTIQLIALDWGPGKEDLTPIPPQSAEKPAEETPPDDDSIPF